MEGRAESGGAGSAPESSEAATGQVFSLHEEAAGAKMPAWFVLAMEGPDRPADRALDCLV